MDIKTSVIECVALALKVDVDNMDEVTGEENLLEYGLNSHSFMQVVVTLEREFGIRFEPDELLIENISTVNKIVCLILQKTMK